MVRCDEEKKKGNSEALYGEKSRGKTQDKGYHARVKSHGRSDFRNKECRYCKKKARKTFR